MVDSDGAETALSITVSTGVIDGKTYYWHRGECLYPFLTCGKYYLKIVDGANTYYSVPFVPECGISDIPDGYQPMRDFNGCVMRDADGEILTEECSEIPPEFAPFMITIDTTKSGSANDTFILPTTGAGYDADIDWGDGSAIENISGTPGNVTHVYPAPGTYQISITGSFPRIYFNGAGDRLKLSTIDQWGDIAWSSMANAFMGCENMNGNYSDSPDLSIVTDLSYMFSGCILFNASVSGFDTSGIINMSFMFFSCRAFNQSLANFNTSDVTDMRSMFNGCWEFNQSVSSFNTANVENMGSMFYGCAKFNQSLASFNTSKVEDMSYMFRGCSIFNQSLSGFDTSNVTTMEGMFYTCLSFNQDISGFDTSKVTNMRNMFYGANLFNQSLATFNTSIVTTMYRMFRNANSFKQSLETFNLSSIVDGASGGLREMLYGIDINAAGTSTNYDNTLIAWAAADVPDGLTFHGGNSKYSDTGETARTSLIDDDSWTITLDGGHI